MPAEWHVISFGFRLHVRDGAAVSLSLSVDNNGAVLVRRGATFALR